MGSGSALAAGSGSATPTPPEVLGLVDVTGKGKIQAIAKGTDFSTAIERYDVTGTPSNPADAITFPFNDCGC